VNELFEYLIHHPLALSAGLFVGALTILWFPIEGILTGVVFQKTGSVHRDREPFRFWSGVVGWFLFSALVFCFALAVFFGPAR
jgi:hypothetical protein